MAKQRASKRKPNAASKSTKREKSLLNSTGAFSSNAFAAKPTAVPPPAAAPESSPSVPDLIATATALLHDQNDTHESLALVTLALTLGPTSLPALELLAEIHIELGDEDAARAVFEKAVGLDPRGERSGPEKFLWLAQLGRGGAEMLQWYARGVDVLRRWIRSRDSGNGKAVEKADERGLDGKLCSALCAMAEIYMTDLCMESDAEARCESYVTEALLLAPSSPEALQTLASIRISQQRPADAVAALQRSFSVWKHLTADTVSGDDDNQTIPTYASRINLAKLLIETAQHETALDVLERLQAEDDQLPDLWYLGGWCLFLLGQQEEEEQGVWRAERWAAGREWLRGCEALCVALEWEDEGIREHAAELLASINAVLPEDDEDEDEEEEEEEEEEEWEDDEDDEDDEMD